MSVSSAALNLPDQPASPATPAEPCLAAFTCDAGTSLGIEQALGDAWPDALIRTGGLTAAKSFLAEALSPPVVVLDIDDSMRPLDDVRALAEYCDPRTRIVLLGSHNDLTLYKQLMAAGAADYVVKPLKQSELGAALARAAAESKAPGAAPAPSGRLVTVIGARGGVGASAIAASAAWLTAEGHHKRTVLLDLDVQYGTAALSLDLLPVGGLIEALRNPKRVDGLFMANALIPKSKHLSVMAAEEELDGDGIFRPAGVERIIEELRRGFEWVWVDLPRAVVQPSTAAIQHAQHIIIVSDLSLAGMRDTVRLRSYCRSMAPNTACVVALNRVGRGEGLSLAQFERGIEGEVGIRLFEDAKSAAAATAGKPLVEACGRGKSFASLRDFVEEVAGTESRTRRRGLIGRAFGRKV